MTELLSARTAAGRPDVVETIHARTDGIPLHIEELIGLLGASGMLDAERAVDRAQVVPDTLDGHARRAAWGSRCGPRGRGGSHRPAR